MQEKILRQKSGVLEERNVGFFVFDSNVLGYFQVRLLLAVDHVFPEDVELLLIVVEILAAFVVFSQEFILIAVEHTFEQSAFDTYRTPLEFYFVAHYVQLKYFVCSIVV